MKTKLLSTVRTPGRKRKPSRSSIEIQKLYPASEELSRFLATSGDTQLEHAKDATWGLNFSATAFPPSIFFRLLIELQIKEKTLDDAISHRTRDHFRHMLYVYILGVSIYEENRSIRRRIDEQLSFLKRKHSLTKFSNCEVFAELWKCFALFHDIAYPIERLHCDNKKVREFVHKELIQQYREMQNAYCEEYVLRIIANLSALISQTDVEEADFQYLVFDHLPEEKQQELSAKLLDAKVELEGLKSSRPFSAIGTQSISLLGEICGNNSVFLTIELASTGEILWVSDLDGEVKVQVREYKKIKETNPLRIVFGTKTAVMDELNVECYLLSTVDVNQKFADIFRSEILYESIATLSEQMREHENYRCAVARADRIDENLSALAYSLLCSEDFIDYNNENRFEEQSLPDVIRSTLISFQSEIPGFLSGALEAILQKRLEEGSFEPAELISNNEINAGHQMMALSAFGLDELMKLLKKRLRGRFKEGNISEKTAISTFDAGLKEFLDIDNNTIGQLVASLKTEIKPRIMQNITRATAIGKCFSIIKPTVKEIVSEVVSSECSIFPILFGSEPSDQDFIKDIYSKLKQFKPLQTISRKERESLEKIGKNYDPKWVVDHGLYSGLLFLGQIEFTNALLKRIRDRLESATIARLMTDNGLDFNASTKIKLNNIVSEVGFRAIALHNFYPAQCEGFSNYKHNLNDYPFTFFAILTDALQNWDRDVQYNPGRSDLRVLKPEDFYDISIFDDRIVLRVNGRYTNLQKISDLKGDFSSYLRDFDSILDVQVFY